MDNLYHKKPFIFNFAAMAIIPANVTEALSLGHQIDILYAYADSPTTNKSRSIEILNLIMKMKRKTV